MKKVILAILILGIVCGIVISKKNTADPGENTGNTAAETTESAEAVAHDTTDPGENTENTTAGTSESAEAAANEHVETVNSLQIELKEGQVGTVSPD